MLVPPFAPGYHRELTPPESPTLITANMSLGNPFLAFATVESVREINDVNATEIMKDPQEVKKVKLGYARVDARKEEEQEEQNWANKEIKGKQQGSGYLPDTVTGESVFIDMITDFHIDRPENSDSFPGQDTISMTSTSSTLVDDAHNPPLTLTEIDLSKIPEAVESIWNTGRLPEWLRHHSSLRILRAQSLGLLVVDDWVSELRELQELWLDDNTITTWPYFLADMPNIDMVSLTGNPCLKMALRKSPLLQSEFLNGVSVRDSVGSEAHYRFVPHLIRGPEWAPAATLRQSPFSLAANLVGFYCGGIYTLSTPPAKDMDGLLTSLEPCVLQHRLITTQGPSSTVVTAQSEVDVIPQDAVKPSLLVMDMLRDISALAAPRLLTHLSPALPAEIAYLTERRSDLSWALVARFCAELSRDEELYARQLDAVMRYFFAPNIKASAGRLIRQVFAVFPDLFQYHRDRFLGALRKLVEATSRSRHHPKFNSGVALAVAQIATALSRSQRMYHRYGGSLAIAEAILHQVSSPKGNVPVLAAAGVNGLGALSSWLGRQRVRTDSLALEPEDFVRLPYIQSQKYELYFSSFTRRYPCFASVARLAQSIRHTMEANYHQQRQLLRIRGLAMSLKTDTERFDGYEWDACIGIYSRAYFERGILASRTNDVIDPVTGKAVSFVKEVFHDMQRSLRLIGCGNQVHIWDDELDQCVGSMPIDEIDAVPEGNHFRLYFWGVRETCTAHIIEFYTVKPSSLNDTDAFLAAVTSMHIG